MAGRNLARKVQLEDLKYGEVSIGDGIVRPCVDVTAPGTVCCKYRKVKFRNANNPDDAAPTIALGIVCTGKWIRLLHM